MNHNKPNRLNGTFSNLDKIKKTVKLYVPIRYFGTRALEFYGTQETCRVIFGFNRTTRFIEKTLYHPQWLRSRLIRIHQELVQRLPPTTIKIVAVGLLPPTPHLTYTPSVVLPIPSDESHSTLTRSILLLGLLYITKYYTPLISKKWLWKKQTPNTTHMPIGTN